jgi:hypothetical protein
MARQHRTDRLHTGWAGTLGKVRVERIGDHVHCRAVGARVGCYLDDSVVNLLICQRRLNTDPVWWAAPIEY